MSDIRKILTTSVSETLIGTYSQRFELTDYTDSTSTLFLAASRYESIGGFLYVIENGDYEIDVTAAVSDGTWYVHVKDGGSGTATAYLDSNKGTFDPNLGGFYYTGAKVVYQITKSGTSWTNKGRLERQNITYEDLEVLANLKTQNIISQDIQTTDILSSAYAFNALPSPVNQALNITEIAAWDVTKSYTSSTSPVSLSDSTSSFITSLTSPDSNYVHLASYVTDVDWPSSGTFEIYIRNVDFQSKAKLLQNFPSQRLYGTDFVVSYDLYDTFTPGGSYNAEIRHVIAKVENG